MSTPNLSARSLSYFFFLLLPIPPNEPSRFASAPKSGIYADSYAILLHLFSVLANPASIYSYAAFILALTSSTVSRWPSSSSYLTGPVSTGAFANSSYSIWIFCSTAAVPASSISYNYLASSFASATV